MKLICYPTSGPGPEIRPAPQTRDWMDNSRDRFAYRCLPLNVANSHGWEILCAGSFEASWNGGSGLEDVTVRRLDDGPEPALSHFGEGVLTFHVGYLFRTEPGHNLWVMGPPNRPKDGIFGLAGLIETDWAPYTFTMNWKFTRPGARVTFEKGEPFCFFFPVGRGVVESVEPEIRSLDSDPETQRAFKAWVNSRVEFLGDLRVPGADATRERWQKNYFRGLSPDGDRQVRDHQTKLSPRPFADRTRK